MRRFAAVLAAVILGGGFVPGTAPAQSLPEIVLELRLSGLQSPVVITHAGDGSGRHFIVEQRGVVRIAQNGALLPAPFLDITTRVLVGRRAGSAGPGLSPELRRQANHFYVYYTNLAGDNVVARYAVSTDPNIADRHQRADPPDRSPSTYANHNGGQLAFGPGDGFLYIGTGDGGGAGDPFEQCPESAIPARQDPAHRRGVAPAPGTHLRDPRRRTRSSAAAGFAPEIWALGLRNPWRFSFDRAHRRPLYRRRGPERLRGDRLPAGGQRGRRELRLADPGGSGLLQLPRIAARRPAMCRRSWRTTTPRVSPSLGGYVYRGTEIQPYRGRLFLRRPHRKDLGPPTRGGDLERQPAVDPRISDQHLRRG